MIEWLNFEKKNKMASNATSHKFYLLLTIIKKIHKYVKTTTTKTTTNDKDDDDNEGFDEKSCENARNELADKGGNLVLF
mgnify:CR=1 FL=1